MTNYNQHIRPISGFALLLCLLLPVASTYFFLQLEKYKVRRMVKHELMNSVDRSELTLIVLTTEEAKTQLNWEHPGEFEYRGQMYDVVDRKVAGDSAYYWCWWDQEETALNRQLDECVAKLLINHPTEKQQQQRLISFYQSLFCNEHTLRFPSILPGQTQYPKYIAPHYVEPAYQPLSPPPDFLVS